MMMTGRPRHGLIGYGISMYKPLCAFTCRDVLSSSVLNCSAPMDTSQMEEGMDSATSPECYATDDAFLDTLAYCISTHCQDATVWDLERYWTMNVAGTLSHQPLPKASYQQTLATITKVPTGTLVIGEKLNRTSIISSGDYESSYNAQGIFEKMEVKHETYGCVSAWSLRVTDRADRSHSVQHCPPCQWIRYTDCLVIPPIRPLSSGIGHQIQRLVC